MGLGDCLGGVRAFRQGAKGTRDDFRLCDLRRGKRFVASLARHRDKARMIVPLLQRNYRGYDRNLMEWLEPFVAEVAGMMRLDEAVPVLVERLHEDDLSPPEFVLDCLVHHCQRRGGADDSRPLEECGWHFRRHGAEILELVHTDLSVEKCLGFLHAEKEPETRLFLANACWEISRTRRLSRCGGWFWERDLDPEEMDLRLRLVTACALMGVSFPEYERWYADAAKSKWGWRGLRTGRIRRNFREDQNDFDPGWDDGLDMVEPPAYQAPKPPLLNLFEGESETPGPRESGRKQVGRNDPCPCGSGKKFKKCCMKKQDSGDSLLN